MRHASSTEQQQVDDMNAVDAMNADTSDSATHSGPRGHHIRMAAIVLCAVFWVGLIYFALA